MNIAIIGSGNVGTALATKWIAAGHNVVFGVRDPQSPKALQAYTIGNTQLLTLHDAVQASQVIVITTPAHVVLDLVPQWGNVEGKIIIDATNAVRMKPEGYETAYHALQANTPAKVVKCFNSTGVENMINPLYEVAGEKISIDMFAAGDDAEAKQTAQQLALDAGFGECYDFGGSDKVELLEKFALSWINLAIIQGHGRAMGFKLLKR
jgi:8-hydroxy-5-deazaflavin:NADPH oxidoreductase